MLPPLPRCSGWAYSSLTNHPSVSAFPDSPFGSACTSSFSRFAQRSLALRPAHAHGHQIRDRYPGASDISSPPCLPRLLPAGAVRRAGLAPTGKRRLLTAHTRGRHSAGATAKAAEMPRAAIRAAMTLFPGIGAPQLRVVPEPNCGCRLDRQSLVIPRHRLGYPANREVW